MTISSQCLLCAHFHCPGSCDAFNKIPTVIITGAFDHRKPYPGDHGVRWTRSEQRRLSKDGKPSN